MTTLRAYVRLATKLLLMKTLLAQTSTSARSVLTPATRTPIAATLTVASPARAKLVLLAVAQLALLAPEAPIAREELLLVHDALLTRIRMAAVSSRVRV